ncbi:hypothetical protein [Sediminitomix flava]|uniref:Lipoprotein n=1 Tax=Sediminitomix flava TaxID=379075 RepID=A0A315Z6D6_SEDFL|nr:hypothetical protein [Sediminitomix flava]PWJ38656.1 hypothetical protein BC781_107247 [Sediminitomix flava]
MRFYQIIFLFILASCGVNKDDLITNYEKNSKEIQELHFYFRNKIPKNYSVQIRFNSKNNFDLSVFDTDTRQQLIKVWDFDLESFTSKPDFLNVKEHLNLTDESFIELFLKLEEVNCIGISNGNPAEIEYGYRGLGVYSYLLFEYDLNSSQQKKYSDNCSFQYYKDNIVLAFNSGAFGNECISDFKSN